MWGFWTQVVCAQDFRVAAARVGCAKRRLACLSRHYETGRDPWRKQLPKARARTSAVHAACYGSTSATSKCPSETFFGDALDICFYSLALIRRGSLSPRDGPPIAGAGLPTSVEVLAPLLLEPSVDTGGWT